jgi:hypothetical protein
MSADQLFVVTEDHLKLARRMVVGWCGDEYGAPEIDPKRPYGNSNVVRDMREILGVAEGLDDEDVASRLRLLVERVTVCPRCGVAVPSRDLGRHIAAHCVEGAYEPVTRVLGELA